MANASGKKANRYEALIQYIFSQKYAPPLTKFSFSREEIEKAASVLNIQVPKNLGDVLYSFRYRVPLPEAIIATQPKGYEWAISGLGKGLYEFRLSKLNRIIPRDDLKEIKIPNATPEIIELHSMTDEQALLAKVRYNRLIDVFLGITAFSLQNHLRTTVKHIGQIEVDEIYVALDKLGKQYVIPVQAKTGHDKHGVIQTSQDIALCKEKFGNLICRPVSVQFMPNKDIAMMELTEDEENGEIKVVDEKLYRLVPASDLT